MYTWPFEHDIKVLALIPGMAYREDDVLEALREWRIRGEWFEPSALRIAIDKLYA